MLEDIPNPFGQVVNRHRRPSHPAGRNAPEPGRVVVPVRTPASHVPAGEPPVAHQPADETPSPARITAEPGPGEVTPPSWWNRRPSPHS
jgi:hypothetical protein